MLAGDETGYRTILELGYDIVSRGIVRAYRLHARDKEDEAEETLTKFLCEKLDRKFVEHLADADEPLGLLFRSAQNYAVQLLRKGKPVPPEQPPAEAEFDIVPEVEDAGAVLGALTIEQRALLHVFYVERSPPSSDVVRWIAAQRGVDVSLVRAELQARVLAVESSRGVALEEVESRYAELLRLQSKHAVVWRAVRELDCVTAPPAAVGEQRLSALRTEIEVRRATPGERSALLARLEERIETQRRLQNEAVGKATDPLAKHPDYLEVARILGIVGPGSTAAEQKTAVNTITVKIKRLRSALARQRAARARE